MTFFASRPDVPLNIFIDCNSPFLKNARTVAVCPFIVVTSDRFAGLAHDASHILDQLRWHAGKPNVEPANDA